MFALKLFFMRLRASHFQRKTKALMDECLRLEFRCGRAAAEHEVLRRRIAAIEQERGESTKRIVWGGAK